MKDFIKSYNPQNEAASKCGIIDCQKRFEHFTFFGKECNEIWCSNICNNLRLLWNIITTVIEQLERSCERWQGISTRIQG